MSRFADCFNYSCETASTRRRDAKVQVADENEMTSSPTTIWTRGSGCASLAETLGGARARKADGDLRTVCIETRADLLVARSLTSFDLIDIAVPHHFVPERVTDVVAAVAGGPHSSLATKIASLLATNLDIPGRIVTASRTPEDDARAEAVLAAIDPTDPALPRSAVRAANAKALVEGFSEGTLLVLGTPGGSWMQRQFFGPGRKLLYSAPAGAVIVRSAPRRCFQAATEANPFGLQMKLRDARRIIADDSSMPVADAGTLVGVIRKEALLDGPDEATVGDVMETPVFLQVDDPLDDVEEIQRFLGGGPVPIVDHSGALFGVINAQNTGETTHPEEVQTRDSTGDPSE